MGMAARSRRFVADVASRPSRQSPAQIDSRLMRGRENLHTARRTAREKAGQPYIDAKKELNELYAHHEVTLNPLYEAMNAASANKKAILNNKVSTGEARVEAENAYEMARRTYKKAYDVMQKEANPLRVKMTNTIPQAERTKLYASKENVKSTIRAKRYGGDVEIGPAAVGLAAVGTAGVAGARAALAELRDAHENKQHQEQYQIRLKHKIEITKKHHPEMGDLDARIYAQTALNRERAAIRDMEMKGEESGILLDIYRKGGMARGLEMRAGVSEPEAPTLIKARTGVSGKLMNKKYNKQSLGKKIKRKISSWRS